MEAMTNFTQHTLPDATERIEGALVFGRPHPPRNGGRLGPHHRAPPARRRHAGSLRSRLSSSSTSKAIAGRVGPGHRWAFGRFWHGLFDGAYKRPCGRRGPRRLTPRPAALISTRPSVSAQRPAGGLEARMHRWRAATPAGDLRGGARAPSGSSSLSSDYLELRPWAE